MLNLRKTAFSLFALLLLTACPTPPKQIKKITPIETQMAPKDPEPKATDVIVVQTNQLPSQLARSVVNVAELAQLLRGQKWISWAGWCQTNAWGKIQMVKGNPDLAYEMQSPAGALSLSVGSRMAYWDGLGVALGFEPQVADGQLLVHALDVVKNFAPLMVKPVLRTGLTIVIDAGHGGENTGAKSALNETYEKDYTLDWALRVQPLLTAKGWNVFLTRTQDIDLSATHRVAFAEKVQADLFVSLHFNSVKGASARNDSMGIETYCLTPTGMPSNIIREYDDDPRLVYPNNVHDTENLQYAVRLHRALIQASGRKDRGIRRARFMTVLQGQKRPAVLLEGGFISNVEEAKLIASPNYRQRLAQAVATALSE
ncbi:MAG: N-acetylmuramoyl-L-alanine amidase [Verrucomicrobia bacterium]|nr:N-acetylmuramoyl-L-alanine amidase [Verrucomicrobiota bacterium]